MVWQVSALNVQSRILPWMPDIYSTTNPMFHLDIQYALKRNMHSSNLLFFPQTVSFPQRSPPQLMATSILPVAQVKNLEFTNPTSNLSADPISSVFRTSPASTPNPATCPHFHCKYPGPDITQLTAALLLPQGPWATLGFSLSLRHGGPAPAHSEALHMLFLPRKVLIPRKYRRLHNPLSHLLQVFSRWPLSVSPPPAILLKTGIHLPFPSTPYFSLPALFLKITTWHSIFFCFPGGSAGKESTCQCRRCKGNRFDPWVRKIP